MHRGHDIRPRLHHGRVHVVGGGARLELRRHHLPAVDVVFDEVGRGDLLHEKRLGLDEKMIRLARHARGNVVVGEIDVDEVADESMRRRELAAQRPFGVTH
jgi:hypothetical protein